MATHRILLAGYVCHVFYVCYVCYLCYVYYVCYVYCVCAMCAMLGFRASGLGFEV